MRSDNAPVIRLDDYRPPDYLIETVDLRFRLDPEATKVTSCLLISPRPGTAAGTPLVLVGDGLVLQSVCLDGRPIGPGEYEATPDELTIAKPRTLPFRLEIVTQLDPTANTALMGLYRSGGIYTTQCEAEGFRRITYFLDRPDVLAVFTTRLEARKSEAPILLGNGNLVETGDVPGSDRHFAVWHDPFPKPSYLFALVGGDLAQISDRFITRSGRDVKLGIYCEPGNEDRCHYAMDSLKRSMRWDEERFGREYDLDIFNIVAVSDFNMGAMENKGLNIFNDKYILVDEQTGTDQDYANVEAVIAHEYFHNWTGNRITCRDWFQLCLKEGLTVFRDQEFSSDMRSRAVKRTSDVVALRQNQFPEDAGPLAHPPRPITYKEINNFYTATVYEKGAEICRMLQTVLGAEGFRAGMDLYFERHDGQAATIEDFLACFADATATDLTQFGLWYSQAGTPLVTVSTQYDRDRGRLRLQLQQDHRETPDRLPKHPLHIPIAFGLVGPDGQDLSYSGTDGLPVRDGVIHLTSSRGEVVFDGVHARPVPSLFRGFSAPVDVRTDLSTSDLLFLIGHDPDPFNRWEASQTIALEMLKDGAAAVGRGQQPVFDPRLAEELRRLACSDDLDPAFRALALQLPSESEVAQKIGHDVDPDAIHTARRELGSEIGRQIGEDILVAAGRCPPALPYSPDAENAGRRSFNHVARSLALLGGSLGGRDIADSFSAAENLTDRLAAFRLLTHLGQPEAAAVGSAFYDRYQDTPLVIDKWFAVHATVPTHAALETVQSLIDHPAFSLKVPNRVYALIRSFGAANPVAFSRPDGAGYEFIAEMISRIDGQNPSVAARLATAFRSYRTLEANRQAKAESALRQLAALPLSRDVSDIVERTLAT